MPPHLTVKAAILVLKGSDNRTAITTVTNNLMISLIAKLSIEWPSELFRKVMLATLLLRNYMATNTFH